MLNLSQQDPRVSKQVSHGNRQEQFASHLIMMVDHQQCVDGGHLCACSWYEYSASSHPVVLRRVRCSNIPQLLYTMYASDLVFISKKINLHPTNILHDNLASCHILVGFKVISFPDSVTSPTHLYTYIHVL